VWASARAVIRASRRKLSKVGKTRAQRAARHRFYREMLEHHAHARAEYRAVMSGNI
jgi:hypothetical protein